MSFQLFTVETAPEGAKQNLKTIAAKKGFVPNIAGIFAGAPPVLDAFLELGDLMDKTSFTPVERDVVFLAVSHRNDSPYCLAAHRKQATADGISEEVIESLQKDGSLEDAKLEALRQYALGIMENHGRPSDEKIQAFLDAGYKPEQALEIVLAIALKTLTNYTMRLAHPPIDDNFKASAKGKSGEAGHTSA